MPQIEPEVYCIAKTDLDRAEFDRYLKDIGEPNWKPTTTIPGELLIEAAGRMCYRSWQPYDPAKPHCSQPNVSKVREDSKVYFENVLKSRHGSILEHVNMSFICRNVSRIYSHELVRHRAGCAYSQESLRYVRLNIIDFWMPEAILENEKGAKRFREIMKQLGEIQVELAELYDIDNIKSFDKRKELTSAFRRLAPDGLATTILFTANIRALRHIIAMRTDPHAEAEIRLVFDKVAEVCKNSYPFLFQDMERKEDGSWTFEYLKV